MFGFHILIFRVGSAGFSKLCSGDWLKFAALGLCGWGAGLGLIGQYWSYGSFEMQAEFG